MKLTMDPVQDSAKNAISDGIDRRDFIKSMKQKAVTGKPRLW